MTPDLVQTSGQISGSPLRSGVMTPDLTQISGQISGSTCQSTDLMAKTTDLTLRSGVMTTDLGPDQWSTTDLTTGLRLQPLIWPLICPRPGVMTTDLKNMAYWSRFRGVLTKVNKGGVLDVPWYTMEATLLSPYCTMGYHNVLHTDLDFGEG